MRRQLHIRIQNGLTAQCTFVVVSPVFLSVSFTAYPFYTILLVHSRKHKKLSAKCMHTSFCKAMNWAARLHCLFFLFFCFFSSNEPFGARDLQRKSTLSALGLSFRWAFSILQGRAFTKWVLFTFSFFLSFFLYSVLGIKSRALHMLGKSSTTELHPRPLILIFQNLIHAHVFLQTLFVCYKTRQRKLSLR